MADHQPHPLTYRAILEYSKHLDPTPGELRSLAMQRIANMRPAQRALLAEIVNTGLSGGHPDLSALTQPELAILKQMSDEETEARHRAEVLGVSLEEARKSVALDQEIDQRKLGKIGQPREEKFSADVLQRVNAAAANARATARKRAEHRQTTTACGCGCTPEGQ